MATTTSNPDGDEGPALLEEAAARNAAIELQYESTQGELLVAKSRILGLDETRLYLDSPQSIGAKVKFRRGQQVAGYVLLNEVRYAFKSSVTELAAPVHINRRKRVVGMIIRRPATVTEGQRRTHFRVSLLESDPVPLDLHAALPDHPGACPVNARRFRAALANLSVGGAGLQVAKEDARDLNVNDVYFMTFRLPREPEPFFFLVEVRQIWTLEGRAERRVGVKIKPWPTRRELARMQQRLQRYITAIQRRRLRRAG